MYQNSEIYIFIVTVYTGILIGLIYDMYRAISYSFKVNKVVRVIEVSLFWTITSIVQFFILHKVNGYDLRFYNFLGVIIGLVIYFNTISKYILKLNLKIIKKIISIFKFIFSIFQGIYYAIVYPIHLIFDIIIYKVLTFRR
ncbi:spore cortex biosynthesis protein YabQ [Alkalithermobacter thermoalcaliphilus JW-YL-7 = DSM 7308]|uniref:Spore cortex biosynthesis protein YabQ n=1 Tax=Alkalithermobacter thermoalcaliphilus JW-YL-7 = DSM 7308 TaxID=1121328 RepID=A0A150FSL8_CLOPD|nr:spore cortex biosynthesis protein YabQ [[Clostridium] paradoxum JW-YL-7 = DSM 7308]SHK69507.1 spore cortex biosynthesis protein YabQ [[Clostridium] paradoxum JW-YL-7 = DSM 7308]